MIGARSIVGPQTATSCGVTVHYVGPTQGASFQVNNPAATCLDAGPDAPAYDGTVDVGDATSGRCGRHFGWRHR
jgi:hypothetical protein